MDGVKESQSQEITAIPKGMRCGSRIANECSLKIIMCQAIPVDKRDGFREITDLYCEPEARRKKLGTILMNLVCQEADANGITLVLIARPYADQDGIPEASLVAWYKKFGFDVLQDTPLGLFMARQVHMPVRPVIDQMGKAKINRSVRMAIFKDRAAQRRAAEKLH